MSYFGGGANTLTFHPNLSRIRLSDAKVSVVFRNEVSAHGPVNATRIGSSRSPCSSPWSSLHARPSDRALGGSRVA